MIIKRKVIEVPKTKFDKPRYPPINNLRAAILERKFVSGFSWGDLGEAAGLSASAMRKLATTKPPQEWSEKVRTAVCRRLEIKVNVNVTGE